MFIVKQVQDVSVIDASGELSRHNMHYFEDLLQNLSTTDCHNIVLNLQGLRHLDYRLVQRIADRIIQFQCEGGDLKMANASGYIRQIFDAMGLDETLYESVEDALLSFLEEGREETLQ
ncbi:MAG: STAS domain-containing protein [Deltaproteobacteria bacterium]|nr:STAS domain-containing protein [Deltaproteobacteria bacterium]